MLRAGLSLRKLTDRALRTPMVLLTSAAQRLYPAEWALTRQMEIARLLADSVDFSNEYGEGFDMIHRPCTTAAFYCRYPCVLPTLPKTRTFPNFILWVLHTFDFELKSCFSRGEYVALLSCSMAPGKQYHMEEVSNVLLAMGGQGDPHAADPDFYLSVLHTQIADVAREHVLERTIERGGDIHRPMIDLKRSPWLESPTSLAMYSCAAFSIWCRLLSFLGLDLDRSFSEEYGKNYECHKGWQNPSFCLLANITATIPYANPVVSECCDCKEAITGLIVHPSWRHTLEHERRRSGNPLSPSTRLKESMKAPAENLTLEKLDELPRRTYAHRTKDYTAFACGSGTQIDPRGYPHNVDVQKECLYSWKELTCMACWLRYILTGARPESVEYPT